MRVFWVVWCVSVSVCDVLFISIAKAEPADISQIAEAPGLSRGVIAQVAPKQAGSPSVAALQRSTAQLMQPMEPRDETPSFNSPVKGQGLIIGDGAGTVFYSYPGTGTGAGYLPYGFAD